MIGLLTKESHGRFANQDERKFEAHFWILESIGGLEQGSRWYFAEVTNGS